MATSNLGRNLKVMDWERIDRMLMAGCTGVEISSVFDMHEDTLYRRTKEEKGMSFTEYSGRKRYCGDSLLREKQFEKALEKDNTMLIWLGKHRLQQWEKQVSPTESGADVLRNMLSKISSNEKEVVNDPRRSVQHASEYDVET